MKGILLGLIILCAIPFLSFAQNVFKDNFPKGKPELRWAPFPFFNLDNLEGEKALDAPDGDGGIGVLSNANAGGFASLSYAVTPQVENFYLEAYLYCPVTKGDKGPLVGLAFLIDPIRGNFYRIVCDFKTNDPNINIAYVGRDTRHYPVYLRFWGAKDIPGGIPKESKWHKIAIRIKSQRAIFYWNGHKLSGEPIIVDKIKKGFVGVYTNYTGGLGEASTKIDAFILKKE